MQQFAGHKVHITAGANILNPGIRGCNVWETFTTINATLGGLTATEITYIDPDLDGKDFLWRPSKYVKMRVSTNIEQINNAHSRQSEAGDRSAGVAKTADGNPRETVEEFDGSYSVVDEGGT